MKTRDLIILLSAIIVIGILLIFTSGCIKYPDIEYDPHKVTFDFTDTGLYFRAYTKIDTVIYGPVETYKYKPNLTLNPL